MKSNIESQIQLTSIEKQQIEVDNKIEEIKNENKEIERNNDEISEEFEKHLEWKESHHNNNRIDKFEATESQQEQDKRIEENSNDSDKNDSKLIHEESIKKWVTEQVKEENSEVEPEIK